MKSVIAIIITALFSFLLFRQVNLKNKKQEIPYPAIESVKHTPKPFINLVFYQDVSASIKENGVELISSSLFTPYYNATDRNIKISFGCISDLSAGKLITVTLPSIAFNKPLMPDLHNASITERQKLKESYLRDLKKYELDSSGYFSDKNNRITEFSKSVDSLIDTYRHKLSCETDLITSVNVADKVFNFTGNDTALNFLILNSDGIDSHKRSVTKMRNKVKVILVNAGGNNHTSIDSILTTTLQSPEQAIQFSLSINNNLNQKP